MKRMKALVLLISCLWLGINADTCPSLYLRYSQQHTYCLPPSSTCQISSSKVDAKDIDAILKAHNAYRSRVANGEETTYSLPKASNMLQMVWDKELASVAQKHADQCVFKHDCNECRRVQNFDVGQNLAENKSSDETSKPDWTAVVKGWYDEVKDFQKQHIDNFPEEEEGGPDTGHFTQVIWAESWRVGCGYSMYKVGKEFVQLYTCNYGPAGNFKTHSIYKKGNPCSSCPVNSCCGKSCSKNSYPGLCQISGDNAPQYSLPKGFLFFCSFNDDPDCARTTSGVDKWKLSKTLSGSYLGIVLNGGESSMINFTKPLKVSAAPLCVIFYFRNGPQVAGQARANTAMGIFRVPEIPNFSFTPTLQSSKLSFMKKTVKLDWDMETMMSVSFSVPQGKPPQYLELEEIAMKQGPC